MATTTTNYGFDIPQSTDLVKDGATAIATLGQDIDTAMNTALGTKKAGMVLLNTTSFSAVASQSLPTGTFSATYANYKIITSLTIATAAAAVTGRLRVSGSDNSTASSYVSQRITANGTDLGTTRITDSSFDLGALDTTLVNVIEMDLINPFAATPTGIIYRTVRSTSGGIFYTTGGTHNQSVSYDSFTFLCSNNMTGTVRVYGYNQ
jgi:hypothetical protein